MNVLKTFVLVLLLTGLSRNDASAQGTFRFPFTEKGQRDSVTASLKSQVDRTIRQGWRPAYAQMWKGLFWSMELMLYRPDDLERIVRQQLNDLLQTGPDFQRAYLEFIYTLYPKKFAPVLIGKWSQLSTPKNKAMALEYLAQAGYFPEIMPADSFTASNHYRLYRRRWSGVNDPLPMKADFLQKDFLPGEAVLCSFQSPDRDRPGYLMIRTEEGKWLGDEKGRPLRFTQLARSITNLPYYLTNGNTPQGLFRITGIDTSKSLWIGPTPNLQLVMPFEMNPDVFFGSDSAGIDIYNKWLGPLVTFPGLRESFEAGRIGRSEIIAHGTTIPEAYYAGQTYFPCTPSLGCLCSPEQWSENGERMKSAQWDWVSKLREPQHLPRFLVVANVRDL